MTEFLLQYLWNYKLFNTASFKDLDGKSIEILDFGIWNKDAGADFQMAKIRIEGIDFLGNIELHLKSSDWDLHRHSEDREYQNVILHIVFNHYKDVEFLKTRNIPTIELKNYIKREIIEKYQNIQKSDFVPCQDLFLKRLHSAYFHKKNILAKLEEKAQEFESRLEASKNDYEAVLFHQLAYGFGLKVNSHIFRDLAESVPFSMIRKISHYQLQMEALFYGKSGWLHQVEDSQMELWKREYEFLRQKFQLNEVVFSPKFLRLMPPSFPTIRFSQLANLYYRHQNLFSKIMGANSYESIFQIFEGVNASEYWDTHFNFGKISSKKSPKKLTKEFINNLIINIVLPIKYAYQRQDKKLIRRVLKIYRQIPAENNEIIRRWKIQGIEFQNALETQSCLHQYKVWQKENR